MGNIHDVHTACSCQTCREWEKNIKSRFIFLTLLHICLLYCIILWRVVKIQWKQLLWKHQLFLSNNEAYTDWPSTRIAPPLISDPLASSIDYPTNNTLYLFHCLIDSMSRTVGLNAPTNTHRQTCKISRTLWSSVFFSLTWHMLSVTLSLHPCVLPAFYFRLSVRAWYYQTQVFIFIVLVQQQQ